MITEASRSPPPIRKEPTVPDEQLAPRPRRRRLLLATLAAGALFLALAGSGALAGGGGGSGDSNVVQGTPVQQQDRSDGHRGDGRGRDCPKDRDRPSSSEAANPPV
jgi:hypothetical protein